MLDKYAGQSLLYWFGVESSEWGVWEKIRIGTKEKIQRQRKNVRQMIISHKATEITKKTKFEKTKDNRFYSLRSWRLLVLGAFCPGSVSYLFHCQFVKSVSVFFLPFLFNGTLLYITLLCHGTLFIDFSSWFWYFPHYYTTSIKQMESNRNNLIKGLDIVISFVRFLLKA